MDREELQEMVDGFIADLAEQIEQLDAEITEGVESTIEDLEEIGVPIDDADDLIIGTADPMGMVAEGWEDAKLFISGFLTFLDTLGPAEREAAEEMIRHALVWLCHELREYFTFLKSLEAEENAESSDNSELAEE